MNDDSGSQALTVNAPTESGRSRRPLWVVAGLGLGLLIPSFACIFLCFLALISVSLFGGSGQYQSGGFGVVVAVVRVEGVITAGDNA